ncbi:MAG: hypothetical protein JSV84_13685 [Gemmatimonadota bacterium]|nr:MAG: hypothetical protein JSV84_13685 [Gemmatimonadota bacterium]
MSELHKTGSKIGSTGEHEKSSADDGVDVTPIRWILSQSPRQRLLVLQRTVRSILRLRDVRSIFDLDLVYSREATIW